MKRKAQSIVCFAGCDWWYHNRGLFCPQVMTRLAEHYNVLFINSLGMRVPSLKKEGNALGKILRKLKSFCRFLSRVNNGMHVFSPVSLPFYGTKWGKMLNTFSVYLQTRLVMMLLRISPSIYYINCPPAMEVIERLGKGYLIYERTDYFPEMPGVNKPYITALDDKLTREANLVLYVNRSMWEQGLRVNPSSLLLGHGVDYEYFVRIAQSESIPEDMREIPKPIVGYFGEISDKHIDFELVSFMVGKLPQISFVFVGPVSTDISKLQQFKNMYFLGQKSYPEIPLYGKDYHVGIMPWNQSKWIEYCNPVKLKEYLALGKPVVSTYYPEIEPFRDVVYIASDYEEFVAHIREAVKESDITKVEKRHQYVKEETWDKKVSQIKAMIDSGIRRI